MLVNISPEVAINPLWINFQYLVPALHDISDFSRHWSAPYHQTIHAIPQYNPIEDFKKYQALDQRPFHIDSTRRHFYELLINLINEESMKNLTQADILNIEQRSCSRDAFKKYDLTISFSNFFMRKWITKFCFNSKYLLSHLVNFSEDTKSFNSVQRTVKPLPASKINQVSRSLFCDEDDDYEDETFTAKRLKSLE